MIDKLIQVLLNESEQTLASDFYSLSKEKQFQVLCNIRPPKPASEELLKLQNDYLQEKSTQKGIVNVDELSYVDKMALWQGDITRLKCDAIVNACNAKLLGCFQPLHNCIDNAIHTNAGVQVRIDCEKSMKGCELPNGEVVVTSAYNLPSQYIFHTVGPIVHGDKPTEEDEADLKKCYINALKKAKELGLKSIVFCCISTGVYGYPKKEACSLAVVSVKRWLQNNSGAAVIFNVFSEEDRGYYEHELSR